MSQSRQLGLLPRLVVQDDGEDCIVGDPETGVFVSVPAVGGAVVRCLLAGRSTDEVAEEAERLAGEPVDIASFVAGLGELGFLDGAEGAGPTSALPVRTAPVQQRRWFSGVSPAVAAPFFGRVAWSVYTGALAVTVVTFVTRPDLLPRATDALVVEDVGLSALVAVPLAWLMALIHEAWHWLAARALGLRARFALDVRFGVLLVAETDLSQVWTLPRRQRYGPLLAGMAIDLVIIAVVLALEVVVGDLPLLRLLILVNLVPLLWQCVVFLRTDLYAVMVTALGCTNLWATSVLRAKGMMRRLTEVETSELGQASAADRRASRWFVWLWLLGPVVGLAYALSFIFPVVVEAMDWFRRGAAAGPGTVGFWWTLIATFVMLAPVLLTLGVAIIKVLRGVRSVDPS